MDEEKQAAELVIANKELTFLTDEKADMAAELVIANKELAFQTEENADQAAELVIADKELAFQTEENADQAAELVIADKELTILTDEKADMAAELISVYKKLAFQTGEEADKAAESLTAIKELAFQTGEKAVRAAKLIIANKELAFQTGEEAGRATELIIADKELAFQTSEKADRAAESLTAIKELAFQTGEKADRATELIIAIKKITLQTDEEADRAAELLIVTEKLFFEQKRIEEINNQLESRVNERTTQLEFANKELIESALKAVKDQKDLEETHSFLSKSEKRYKALTQTSIDGFFVVDLEGHFLEVNDAYCKICGYSREALLSMSIRDLHVNIMDKQIDTQVQKIIDDGAHEFESQHRKSDGTLFYVYNSSTFMPDEKTFICLLHDITSRKKEEEHLLYISCHDFLTGLYNRIHFEEEKKRMDTPSQLPISFIMGDVNGLKLVNDGFGHSQGDELLIEISKILKSCCSEEAIVSRIGGDEFGILLPQTDSNAAQKVCSRISDTCNEYALKGSLIYPSISLGYATKKIGTETMEDISLTAEENMYRHKLLERKSAHSSIITSIKAIMIEKSQETEEHAERMVLQSKSIGLAMSLTEGQLNELELLCTLHDIGKIGISSNILSKPGKLSNEEWVEMRKHPEIGFRIAQATPDLIPIAEYILYHHERWDGKGYPEGLIGKEIPLLSRIVALVDSFDAMTNDRAYRPAMTEGEALEEIRRNSGTQFDPEVVRVFIEKVFAEFA